MYSTENNLAINRILREMKEITTLTIKMAAIRLYLSITILYRNRLNSPVKLYVGTK